MKRLIEILMCCVWMSTCGAAGHTAKAAQAVLPGGISVELIGLRHYSIGDLKQFESGEWPWWKPDGTVLSEPPDSVRGRTSSSESYWFVIRVKGNRDCDFKATGPYGDDLTVSPVRQKGRGIEDDDLRFFTLRFASGQKQADIELGVTAANWKVVENWPLSEHATAYNHFCVSSEQVLMRCPEQVGADVVAEVTQVVTERATRLVAFGKDGQQHASSGRSGGESAGLVRHIHRYENMNRNDIERLEFQARSYDYYITFHNVSLAPGHETEVAVDLRSPGSLLPGNPLPDFEGITMDLPDEVDSRPLLICFFDLHQRPSRHCAIQLAECAESLRQEGVTVIAVQASAMESSQIEEWTGKNDIFFPVGVVQGDAESVRFGWGVKSLPWLILTDRSHTVRAAGFSIGELRGQLEQIGGD